MEISEIVRWKAPDSCRRPHCGREAFLMHEEAPLAVATRVRFEFFARHETKSGQCGFLPGTPGVTGQETCAELERVTPDTFPTHR